MAEGDREDDTVLSNAADCRRSSHVDRHLSSRVCTVPFRSKLKAHRHNVNINAAIDAVHNIV